MLVAQRLGECKRHWRLCGWGVETTLETYQWLGIEGDACDIAVGELETTLDTQQLGFRDEAGDLEVVDWRGRWGLGNGTVELVAWD